MNEKEHVDVLLIRLPMLESLGYSMEPSEYLGFGYIAQILRENDFQVKIIDYYIQEQEFDSRSIANDILYINPTILGITITIQNLIYPCKEICYELRKNGFNNHITCGGHLPSLKPKWTLNFIPELDSILRFESEYSFSELAKAITRKTDWRKIENIAYVSDDEIIMNSILPLISNLDELSFPARDYIETIISKDGAVGILSSRGCYGNCDFCSIRSFYEIPEGAKWRGRSAENVVDEIEYLNKTYGANYFRFYDDDFIGPGKLGYQRAERIADLIIERDLKIKFYIETRVNDISESLFAKLKRSGLDRVFIGIESGDENSLMEYNKEVTLIDQKTGLDILNKLKIKTIVGFMMFNPNTTVESFRNNFEFMVKNEILDYYNLLSTYFVLGGTKLEEVYQEKGYLIDNSFMLGYKIINEDAQRLFKILFTVFEDFEPLHIILIRYKHTYSVFENQYDSIIRSIEKQLNEYLKLHTFEIMKLLEMNNCIVDEVQINDLKMEVKNRSKDLMMLLVLLLLEESH